MSYEWGGSLQPHPLRVRIAFTLGTIQAQTGFTLRDASLTAADAQDAAEHVAEWVNSDFKTILTTNDRLLGVDVLDMTSGAGGSVSINNTTGTIAYNAEGTVNSFVTAVVAMKGELRRRYGQGRMIWPVRAEGWIADNVFNGTGVAALQAVIDSFVTRYVNGGVGATYRAVTVHGVIPAKAATATTPARPEVPATMYDVQSLRLNTIPSFLRSRKIGVGT